MRVIRLHPLPEAEYDCPHCRGPLQIFGWYIPGMRNLADLRCPACDLEFYGDLAAGQALYTPMLIEKESGVVHDKHGVKWFADWLRDSFSHRKHLAIPFEVQERLPMTRAVVLLNCLDTLYGHSLLKLLNAQYYLERDVDLIVIIPRCLAWMIPNGVAQVWIIDLPLKRGTEWNDWIATEIRRRIEAFKAVSLSVALSHPNPVDYSIERFTSVRPFPLEQWAVRLQSPTVTFIWRDDRTWQAPESITTQIRTRLIRLTRGRNNPLVPQNRLVAGLAEALHRQWPTVDFAVAGLSEVENQVGLPAWVKDLRRPTMDESYERLCCERYAASHLVIGVHGSNMLLPTAHAGALVELIGAERQGNFAQDILFNEAWDCRDTLFRYRFMPISTSPNALAQLVSLLLRGREPFQSLMKGEPNDHTSPFERRDEAV